MVMACSIRMTRSSMACGRITSCRLLIWLSPFWGISEDKNRGSIDDEASQLISSSKGLVIDAKFIYMI